MERVEEIVKHPGYDDIVVETYEAVDDNTGDTNSHEVGGNGVPRHNGAPPCGLAKGEFKVEERDAKNKQHDGVGN